MFVFGLLKINGDAVGNQGNPKPFVTTFTRPKAGALPRICSSLHLHAESAIVLSTHHDASGLLDRYLHTSYE
jgi:hypothetical protein